MGRNKKKRIAARQAKQKQRRIIKIKMGKNVPFTLTICGKKLSGCVNRYNYKANMHGLIYVDASFCNVKYQASIITKCNFRNSRLIGIDFFNSNLKSSSFKSAILTDVVFYNCNLKDVDFQGAKFTRVAFVSTNIGEAKNLVLNHECSIYRTYPHFQFDDLVEQNLLALSKHKEIHKYRVLHVSRNKLNLWIIKILVDCYGEVAIHALLALKNKNINGTHFFTVYSYKKYIERFVKSCYNT